MQFGIGALPQFHEVGVAGHGLGRVATCFVQLTEGPVDERRIGGLKVLR